MHFTIQKNNKRQFLKLLEIPSIPCFIMFIYAFVQLDKRLFVQREKERDLTQSYDKSPYTYRKIHKNATKNFDYTTIAD